MEFPKHELSPGARVVDLRTLRDGELEPLLSEQSDEWRRLLDWDFSRISSQIRTLTRNRQLRGAALVDDGQVAGCGYAGAEGSKGVIADVYVRQRWRTRAHEAALFQSALDSLLDRGVDRIESQLPLLRYSSSILRGRPGLAVYDRVVMRRATRAISGDVCGAEPEGFSMERWSNRYFDQAAALMYATRAGHVDAAINGGYRTLHGCAGLLRNLLTFPDERSFLPDASFVAFENGGRSVAGLSLSNLILESGAHVSEFCIAPGARGRGLGYALLQRTMAALQNIGVTKLSVIVTFANFQAVRLYRRSGFQLVWRFPACVWEHGERSKFGAASSN